MLSLPAGAARMALREIVDRASEELFWAAPGALHGHDPRFVDAPRDEVAHWISRSMGRLEPIDDTRTRLLASTDEPYWYAGQLTSLPAPYRILQSPELKTAARNIAQR